MACTGIVAVKTHGQSFSLLHSCPAICHLLSLCFLFLQPVPTSGGLDSLVDVLHKWEMAEERLLLHWNWQRFHSGQIGSLEVAQEDNGSAFCSFYRWTLLWLWGLVHDFYSLIFGTSSLCRGRCIFLWGNCNWSWGLNYGGTIFLF